PSSAAVGLNPASDFQVMAWSLEWWPWAIGHGADLLHTHLLWPPEGFSTLWMTTIPVPALLAAPLTLTAGPLVAYNALILLSVVLATGAAYLLCRELTDRLAPSLAGGLLFGLSPYMLGHMLSQHLDLTFVFPVPPLVPSPSTSSATSESRTATWASRCSSSLCSQCEPSGDAEPGSPADCWLLRCCFPSAPH